MTGRTVGHYEILDKLGEGGMGMVYRARDVLLNRAAALKFLPMDGSGATDKRQRFVQEAQSASALNHPNIVTIYEVGQSEDRDFIAMELVQGRSLDEVIHGKPLPTGKAITYAIQIADALAAAHSAGIVHRDLKPGNVMVSDSGVIKVLDFGLAKLVARVAGATEMTQTLVVGGPRTVEGAIVGTVSYMSPEQAESKAIDHRSDIFAFGAVLYEMLTGRRAFQGDSTVSTLAAILTAEPISLSREPFELPPELARIVSRFTKGAGKAMADDRGRPHRARRIQAGPGLGAAYDDTHAGSSAAQAVDPHCGVDARRGVVDGVRRLAGATGGACA